VGSEGREGEGERDEYEFPKGTERGNLSQLGMQ